MGFISDGFKNAAMRREAADNRYTACQFIEDGNRFYEHAREKLLDRQYKTNEKIRKYVEFKKSALNNVMNILKKANATLPDVDAKELEIKLIKLDVAYKSQSSFTTGESAIDDLRAIFATIAPPTIRDFFTDARDELYESKAALREARAYKEEMRAKKEQLLAVADSLSLINTFIDSEQREIERLIDALENAVNNNISSAQVKGITAIAELISKTLTTQFLTNEYVITGEYNALHNMVENVNRTLRDTPEVSGIERWNKISALLR